VVVAVLVAGAFREREPEYGGKKLSEWVLINANAKMGRYERTQEAEQAIRHFGTNAIPFLIEEIEYQWPAWRIRLGEAVEQMPLPRRLEDKLLMRIWPPKGLDAEYGFGILGASARSAMPELISIMNRQQGTRSSEFAMRCMVQIGPEALWPLVGALTNNQSSSRHRQSASFAIGTMESNAAPAIPLLIRCLHDENSGTAICAVAALGRMKIEPAIVVPALTEALESSNRGMRRIVVDYLPNFGNEARPAVPKLVSLLVDPDFTVREGVTNALHRIAPEILTNEVSKANFEF